MTESFNIRDSPILIVGDQPMKLGLLERLLRGAGYASVTSTNNPGEICELHGTHRYKLIVVYLPLSGSRGFEVMELLREIEPESYLPLVAVADDTTLKLRAFEAGAKEFICTRSNESEILVRLRTTLELGRLENALQREVSYPAHELFERAKTVPESESEFTMLAEAIPQIVWIARPDGATIYFNRRWGEYTGLSLEASYGHGWKGSFHPDDEQRAWNAWHHAAAICGVYSLECRVRRADGVYRWWLIRGVPQHDASGKILKWFGVCTDVEDQKHAEEVQARMATIVGSSDDAIITGDLDGTITSWNASAERIFGYSADQMIGRSVMELVPPDRREEEARILARIKRGERVESFETVRLRGDGRLIDISVTVSSIKDGSGRIVGASKVARDITERKRREEDLRRFRAAMDVTTEAIFLLDGATMRFVDANAAACRMLGYSLAEVLAMGPSDLVLASGDELANLYDPGAACSGNLASTEIQLLRKDRSQVWVELNRQVLRSGDDLILVVVARDITERNEANQQLVRLAHYDTLTNLPNRTLFYQSLKTTLLQAEKHHWIVSVFLLDLDRLKNVNDTLGHAAGDQLLRECGRRLVKCLRIRDTVARVGGDEFGMILITPDGPQGARTVANKIRETLRQPLDFNGREFSMTAGIGITIFPADTSDANALIKNGHTAMYRAKEAGGDTYRFYTAQMNAQAMAKLEIENGLRKALTQDGFVLHYQPKMDIATGRVSGVEALLRWNRPGHGLVQPNDFIPILEETGLIMEVGAWVIQTACSQIAEWQRAGIGPVSIAVNLSARQFSRDVGDLDAAKIASTGGAGPQLFDFEVEAASAMRAHGFDPKLLEFELTESTLMSHAEDSVAILDRLKARGIKLSLDDFGTGYSSLAYLKRFPIDTLKIDRAFIRDVTTNSDDAAITVAVIGMAHSLKLKVVAEGVETREQLEFLRRQRCDEIQGYYVSRPLPASEITDLLCRGDQIVNAGFPVPGEDDEATVQEAERPISLPQRGRTDSRRRTGTGS